MVDITYEHAALLGKGYQVVPISASIPTDGKTPSEVFLTLKNLSRHCFILESAEDESRYGRYTFIGYDPKLELSCMNGEMRVKSYAEMKLDENHPAERIKEIIRENASPRIDGLPPFTGGLVGYFSYDYIKYAEPTLHFAAAGDDGFKDVDLMLFDKVVVFDHLENRIILIVNARTDELTENYNRAVRDIENLADVIRNGAQVKPSKLHLRSPFRARHSKAEFCDMVRRAKEYIHEGDIFQVVLSNRYDADAEGSLFETYQILREKNPSPYMLYFSSDDIEIAGSAPETLVSVTDGVTCTYPLAGTRPRGKTPEEDNALEADLLADEKELAEHNMLVDLGRNDIGKISEFGTVTLNKYMEIERFSHVMHIGSKVTGKLRPFETALQKPELSFICEVKRASPSKGLIAPNFPYLEIARQYEAAGADAISVLTEPKYFLGSGEYLREIAASAALPCLCKDFVVDIYQIYEAKMLGAAAVLLICAITPEPILAEYIRTARSLGISALVEAHDEREIDAALNAGARMIGVNNRDLRTFSVDTANAARLRERVPEWILFVSESGVKSAEDIRAAREIRADAVLVGESMMRAADKRAFLEELKRG